MALLDPWDPVLEAVTLRLANATAGHVTRSCSVTWDTGGWELRFRGSRKGVETTLRPKQPPAEDEALNDYQASIVYSFGFAVGDGGEWRRSLVLREGGRWSEQTLREVVQESLAVLRYVFGCPGPDALTLGGMK